jgi:chemotaxis regulatin CheY-phosphate phosphatase CheZ
VVTGSNSYYYSIPFANELSSIHNTEQKWDNILYNNLSKNELSTLVTNKNNFMIEKDVGYNYMNWRLRNSTDCYCSIIFNSIFKKSI